MSDGERLTDNSSFGDFFCEQLYRIDQVGPCRRLIFVTRDLISPDYRFVVAKLVVPADIMADMAQMIAADRPMPREFSSLSLAVAN
jgi:hypothetical protein